MKGHMVKRESITGISFTVTHYSFVIVTENFQIKGNLGYSDSFLLSQYLYYNWDGLYLPNMASLE